MIEHLLGLLLFTLGTAALSHFFQMTMEKGMIFRPYAYYIKYLFDYKARKRIKREFVRNEPIWEIVQYPQEARREIVGYKAIYQTVLVSKRKRYFFFYFPLGGCQLCNGEWIYIIVFLCFYLPLSFQDFLLLLLGSGTNYIWIEILSKVK